tara:strand:+ start:720 stop:1154 length:435 start_codon:yes stop_codon:yes gene_type:complete
VVDYSRFSQVKYFQYEPPDEYRRDYFIDEFNKISHSIDLLSGEYYPRRSVSDAKTTDYTATIFDDIILANGTLTINLYTASGGTDGTGNIANEGRRIVVKNIGTNTVTVDPSGSETIDGASTKDLTAQYESLQLVSDGANWWII